MIIITFNVIVSLLSIEKQHRLTHKYTHMYMYIYRLICLLFVGWGYQCQQIVTVFYQIMAAGATGVCLFLLLAQVVVRIDTVNEDIFKVPLAYPKCKS